MSNTIELADGTRLTFAEIERLVQIEKEHQELVKNLKEYIAEDRRLWQGTVARELESFLPEGS